MPDTGKKGHAGYLLDAGLHFSAALQILPSVCIKAGNSIGRFAY
jgi:hypothetical protein